MREAKREIDRCGINATVESMTCDLMTAKDAAFFEANPGRRFYERPPAMGEFYVTRQDGTDVTIGGACEAVLVEQIAPGVRIRRPVFHGDCRADVLARTPPELQEWIERVRESSAAP